MCFQILTIISSRCLTISPITLQFFLKTGVLLSEQEPFCSRCLMMASPGICFWWIRAWLGQSSRVSRPLDTSVKNPAWAGNLLSPVSRRPWLLPFRWLKPPYPGLSASRIWLCLFSQDRPYSGCCVSVLFHPLTPFLLLGYKFPFEHAVFGVEPSLFPPLQHLLAAISPSLPEWWEIQFCYLKSVFYGTLLQWPECLC